MTSLQRAVAILHEVSLEWGMVINYAKCEAIIVDARSVALHPVLQLAVEGTANVIPVVPAARYLGVLL